MLVERSFSASQPGQIRTAKGIRVLEVAFGRLGPGVMALAFLVALGAFGYKLTRYSHQPDAASRISYGKFWDKHQDSGEMRSRVASRQVSSTALELANGTFQVNYENDFKLDCQQFDRYVSGLHLPLTGLRSPPQLSNS